MQNFSIKDNLTKMLLPVSLKIQVDIKINYYLLPQTLTPFHCQSEDFLASDQYDLKKCLEVVFMTRTPWNY